MAHNLDERVVRLLGGDELAPLRRMLRRRFEREDLRNPNRVFRLTGLKSFERAALAQISGAPNRASSSLTLNLDEVDATLAAAEVALSLRAALELLDGPIVHVATSEETETARWDSVISASGHDALTRWLSSPASLGLLKRLSAGEHLSAQQICRGATEVLRRLPADGVALAHLAAECLGDAHALDSGQPVATVVVSVLRREYAPEEDQITSEDDRIRSVWARAGVMVNELARPALILNVPFIVNDDSASASPGQPFYASLRWLLRSLPQWDVKAADVFVCENPNVVAIAADKLGARCAPLVCTDGMPAAAQRVLMAQLVAAGARLRYHGDFDWPGIRIANLVAREHGASAWRMDLNSYQQAASLMQGRGKDLSEVEVDPSWDDGLRAAMRKFGKGIPEEAVVATLLSDLLRSKQTMEVSP